MKTIARRIDSENSIGMFVVIETGSVGASVQVDSGQLIASSALCSVSPKPRSTDRQPDRPVLTSKWVTFATNDASSRSFSQEARFFRLTDHQCLGYILNLNHPSRDAE